MAKSAEKSAESVPADKLSALDWLKTHTGKAVCITQTGTALRAEGVPQGIDEIDGCSADFAECLLHSTVEGLQIALSFHDDVLALHVGGYGPGSTRAALSVSASIPYGELRLAPAADPPKPGPAARKEPTEPEFSPYELLHGGSR